MKSEQLHGINDSCNRVALLEGQGSETKTAVGVATHPLSREVLLVAIVRDHASQSEW